MAVFNCISRGSSSPHSIFVVEGPGLAHLGHDGVPRVGKGRGAQLYGRLLRSGCTSLLPGVLPAGTGLH